MLEQSHLSDLTYGCGSHMAGNSLRDGDIFTGSVSHPSSKLYSASSRTVCLSNKGLGLRLVSSVIKTLVLLSAAVVRIGVNCAQLFARLLLFHWNNNYINWFLLKFNFN
jgi:hypothetical protein